MGSDPPTKTVLQESRRSAGRRARRTPGLLVAHTAAPPKDQPDRWSLRGTCVVGRRPPADFVVADPRLSQQHFRLTSQGGRHEIEDLDSTNGTMLDGTRLEPGRPVELADRCVIRGGETVFIFLPDASQVFDAGVDAGSANLPMAGRFHLPPLLRDLMEAALSHRAPLLAGPSGVGKEHAAEVLASLWSLQPPRRYNVAAAANPEEMSRALFGVAGKAFTGVSEQAGMIVTSAKQNRPLFLDEVHNLSPEAQATLLTVLEDGRFSRKGAEAEEVRVDVRFVFASNAPDRLKHDLRARLWRLDIPSLRDRVADVPDIFRHLLLRQLDRHGIEPQPVVHALDADVAHDLCLEALRGSAFVESNVRGLADVADRIAARIAAGSEPTDAVDTVFAERLSLRAKASQSCGSHYEQHRELITAVYLGCGKNAKKTVDLLRSAGLPWSISRRHLTLNVQRWGLK
ncbi:MAG: sigma 54-interacting transcriptional regulator [Myxococcota bacterium]